MHNTLPLLRAEGYSKDRGQVDAERHEMLLEAQKEWRVSASGIAELIQLRVLVAPRSGDRPHIDVQESAVELTLEEARELADWLYAETGRLELHADSKLEACV